MSGPVLCHTGRKTPDLARRHLPPSQLSETLWLKCEGSRAALAHMLAWASAPRGARGAQPAQLSETSHGLTSSHSEAKEGDFSSLFFPMLQLDRDSLRLPIVASSVGEQVRRSESDLDKLRLSLSSALGLPVGGARLLAPLRSPSSSAPQGCGDAVRVEVSGCVWLWAGGRLDG